jgi:hypothetical protein
VERWISRRSANGQDAICLPPDLLHSEVLSHLAQLPHGPRPSTPDVHDTSLTPPPPDNNTHACPAFPSPCNCVATVTSGPRAHPPLPSPTRPLVTMAWRNSPAIGPHHARLPSTLNSRCLHNLLRRSIAVCVCRTECLRRQELHPLVTASSTSSPCSYVHPSQFEHYLQ